MTKFQYIYILMFKQNIRLECKCLPYIVFAKDNKIIQNNVDLRSIFKIIYFEEV